MSFFRTRGRFCSAVVAVAFVCGSAFGGHVSAQSSGKACHTGARGAFGLTRCERAMLAKLPFAALPDPAPPGFKVVPGKFEAGPHHYRVVYRRADEAEIIYEGSDQAPAIATRPQSTPEATVGNNGAPNERPHGFFQRLLGQHPKLPDANGNASAGFGSGEQERSPNMAAAIASGPAIGTVRFQTDQMSGCLVGHSDASVMRNGQLTVRGCELNSSDVIVRSVQTTTHVSKG